MKPNIYRYDFLMLITLTLTLFATIFNSYHLLPGFDLYHNLIVAVVLSIGLMASFLFHNKNIQVPYSVTMWLLLLGLMIAQPYINTILHPDYLVFPIGTLILTVAVSIAIACIEDKKTFLNNYFMIFVGFMLLSVLIQFMQLRGYRLSYNGFIITTYSQRFDGNIAQPNQTSFMLALAELACLYLYYKNKNKLWLLCSTLFIIGIALTSSRGGLILGVAAIVLFNAFYNQTLIQKLKNGVLQLLGFIVAYSIGVTILTRIKVSNAQAQDAIERFSEGSLGARVALQEQAYLMFIDNPLTGSGWGSFAKGGIEYASEISSFFFSKHSHFFVTQIASELGIIGVLCLVPMVVFIIKKISFKMDAYHAVCFTAIAIIILYSCSEFPLWYLRYLVIFALFITLIDNKYLVVKNSYAKLLAVLLLVVSISSLLYISSYLRLYDTIRYLATHELTGEEVADVYADIPDVFGMSVFKENILFHYIPIDRDAIEGKLSIAERATATELSKSNLFRYARLLALNNESEKSLAMFKAACVLDWKGDCDDVLEELDRVVAEEPQVYTTYRNQVAEWVVTFDSKM